MWFMGIELITKEDLRNFKMELLKELQELFLQTKGRVEKTWLKATEVRKILGISSNTLQSLRCSGKLHSSKVGRIHYYKLEEIEKLMEDE
jgi:DNA-binding Xre family transcriptional regulator